jgi:hypothetical protein|uniref:Uncharacterized protein n=1 Tax=Picea glauca TaxID=3330 RepID=A0A117NGA4_PICGL|nr:hypothetical protein ABT39_MTgene1589 [Picea glauca]
MKVSRGLVIRLLLGSAVGLGSFGVRCLFCSEASSSEGFGLRSPRSEVRTCVGSQLGPSHVAAAWQFHEFRFVSPGSGSLKNRTKS